MRAIRETVVLVGLVLGSNGGGDGGTGEGHSPSPAVGGYGGGSFWGTGIHAVGVVAAGSSENGLDAIVYGGGGGGGAQYNDSSGATGGDGEAGVVFVLEFGS